MHEHESVCHHNCEEHEDSELLHTGESCLACVYINTYVEYHFEPTIVTSPTLYCETPTTDVGIITIKFTATFQSRAPPINSNCKVNLFEDIFSNEFVM